VESRPHKTVTDDSKVIRTTSEGQNNPPTSSHIGGNKPSDAADTFNISGAYKLTVDSRTDAEGSIKENFISTESSA